MDRQEFINILEGKGYAYEIVDGVINVVHKGYVYLDSLIDNVQFNNKSFVDLRSLTSLPDNVQFNNKGSVYLDSLTSLPHNVQFNNEGFVFFYKLNGGHNYRGKLCTFRKIDGYIMLMGNSRKVGDTLVHSARYFGGGEIADLPKCFIAEQNGTYAHGSTIKEAQADLRFKFAQVNYDKSDLIEKIRSEKRISFNDFRLLTGACSDGLRQGLGLHGYTSDLEYMPLEELMSLESNNAFLVSAKQAIKQK